LVLRRARIEEFSAKAPVVCVAVSQRLGRSVTDNGSRVEAYPTRMNSRGGSRAGVRTSDRLPDRPSFRAGTTAKARLNNYVYALEKRQFAANVRSCRKQAETFVPIDSDPGRERD